MLCLCCSKPCYSIAPHSIAKLLHSLLCHCESNQLYAMAVRLISFPCHRLLDHLVFKASIRAISPLPDSSKPAIVKPLKHSALIRSKAQDCELARCALRDHLRVCKRDSLALCRLCSQRSLKVSNLPVERNRDLALLDKNAAINDLLICLKSTGLLRELFRLSRFSVSALLQHGAGVLEKSLKLIIKQDRLSFCVPGEHGHRLLFVFFNADRSDLFLPALCVRSLRRDIFRMQLLICARCSQNWFRKCYFQFDFSHLCSPLFFLFVLVPPL